MAHLVPTGTPKPFAQHSEEMQQKILDKHRDWHTSDDCWSDSVIDEAKQTLSLLGAEVENIYFSACRTQGQHCNLDNVSYSYAPGAPRHIREHFGDCEHADNMAAYATRLQEIQKPYFYQLQGTLTQSERGRSHTDIHHADDHWRDVSDAEEDIRQLFSEFADDILKSLYAELEHLQSDEYLTEWFNEDDSITFDDDGDSV